MGDTTSARRDAHSTADGKDVRRDELDLIAERRREAFPDSHKSWLDELPDDLVGLSLSGGGTRSAAFSLGLLQALHRTRVLAFVDYLSTVSGGGYAGSYLTSMALRRSRSVRPSAEDDADGVGQSDGQSDDSFPIASDESRRASRRMLRFIHGGNYLAHWWQFFNRYIVGLLLMLTVVASGLVAATSAIAWLFRCLDHLSARDWLWALGFQDDLAIAFFPSFLLLLLWAACWFGSYYRRGPRATGQVAIFVFCLLVLSTATAVAVLIGNGEINLGGLEAAWGRKADDAKVQSIASWIWTAIIAAVAAALLPYLSPKRLLKSGVEGKSPWERGVFWVATRALVFGIPFLLISYFAREDISHWNDRRDDRITMAELKSHPDENGGGWSPFWRHLQMESKRWQDARMSHLPEWILLHTLYGAEEPLDQTPGAYLWSGVVGNDDSLAQRMEYCTIAQSYLSGREVGSALLRTEFDDPARWERAVTGASNELRFYERWGSLVALPWQRMFHDDAAESNRLQSMVNLRREIRGVKREMMYIVNCRLLNARFYQQFDPARLRELYPGRTDEEWRELEELISEAEQLRYSVATPQLRDSSDSDSERPSDVSELSACSLCLSGLPVVDTDWPEAGGAPQLDYLYDEDERRQGELVAQIRSSPANEHPQYRDYDSDGRPDPEGSSEAVTSDRGSSTQVRRDVRQLIVDREQRDRAVLNINRRLLLNLYPDSLHDRSELRSYVVLTKDQETRWSWFVWALGIFLVSSLLTDLNAISWHGYYARQVAKMWTEPVPGLGRDIPLGQLETVEVGKPYHLITGSVHPIGINRRCPDFPLHRNHFLFSQLYCGSDSLGYRSTDEWMKGKYELSDAIAVSGGAVSPVENSNPLIACLLTLANVRMGQWVQNPHYVARVPWIGRAMYSLPFTPFRFLMRLFQNPLNRPHVFVADGGHHENLGIEPLLKRRCRLIIASDAGMDGAFEFADFTRLLRWSRIVHGIRIERMDGQDVCSLDEIVPGRRVDDTTEENTGETATKDGDDEKRTGHSDSHYALLRIVYPEAVDESGRIDEERVGYLVYLKSSLRGDEPFDLASFRRQNSEFPHDTTADQFFDAERFESYRQLGEKIGASLCPAMPEATFRRFNGSRAAMRVFIERLVDVADEKRPKGEAWTDVPEMEFSRNREADASATPTMTTPDELPQLLKLLKSERSDSRERESAAVDVAGSGVVNEETVDALFCAALSQDAFVARSAQHALVQLGRRVVPFLRDSRLAVDRPKCQALAAEIVDAIYQECNSLRRRGVTGIPDDEEYDDQLVEILVNLFRKGGTVKVRKQAGFSLGQYLLWIGPNLPLDVGARACEIVEEVRRGPAPPTRSRKAGENAS